MAGHPIDTHPYVAETVAAVLVVASLLFSSVGPFPIPLVLPTASVGYDSGGYGGDGYASDGYASDADHSDGYEADGHGGENQGAAEEAPDGARQADLVEGPDGALMVHIGDVDLEIHGTVDAHWEDERLVLRFADGHAGSIAPMGTAGEEDSGLH